MVARLPICADFEGETSMLNSKQTRLAPTVQIHDAQAVWGK